MKLKDNSMLKKIGNENIILPLSDHNIAVDVILKTNEVGAFIYNCLKEEITKEELLNKILAEYNVDETTALNDLNLFLDLLTKKGLL